MRKVQAKQKPTAIKTAKGNSQGKAGVEKEKKPSGQANGSEGVAVLGTESGNGGAVQTDVSLVKRRATAEALAARQREISISEFFTKNRHLLGFDNPQKALLTAIKEAVDNALDACEEAGILPQLRVEIKQLAEDRFRIVVQDNGPGIVKNQIPKIFGKLLYGSKFHTLKQSRGQQGIGISAAGMYGQLTTARPICITSRIGKNKPAHYYEIQINTLKNAPEVVSDQRVDWDVEHGTRVEIELQAIYKKGRRSVDDYIAQTAIANPHAEIIYQPPSGEVEQYPRVVDQLPPEPMAIRPHPYGVELGMLIKMLKDSKSRNLKTALEGDFSRVSPRIALEICRQAELDPASKPNLIAVHEAEKLFRAISQVKIMSPPTNCLSPIGEAIVRQGLEKKIKADFHASVTRPPAVYRGNPFQVEVGIAYGGELAKEEPIELLRFANRVPLLYQQSACAITKAVTTVDWRNYGLQQPRGSLPFGPMILFVHIASVWVPFTSESKEAIAHYPDILRELRLSLQECGRQLGLFLRSRHRQMEAEKKRSYIEKFIPHIGIALNEILGLGKKEETRVVETLKGLLERSRE